MKTQSHEEFLHAVLFLGMLFRFFVIVIIISFVFQRSGDLAQAFLSGCGSALFVFLDAYFTLRQVYKNEDEFHHQLLYAVTKIVLIVILLLYALGIWLSFHYWAYPAFALFVAALYAVDFLLVSRLKKMNTKRISS